MYEPGKALNGFYKSLETRPYAQRMDQILVRRYYMDDFFISLANSLGFQLGHAFENVESFVDNTIIGSLRSITFGASGTVSKVQSGVLQKYVRSFAGGLFLLIFLAVIVAALIITPISF